jgi:hypothetical protein
MRKFVKLALLVAVILGALQTPSFAVSKPTNPCAASKSVTSNKLPKDFTELIAKRNCISFAAWQQISNVSAKPTTTSNIQVIVGPNTKPWYTNSSKAATAVINSFPSSGRPSDTYFIYYNFKDSAWAKEKVKSLTTKEEFSNISRNENGRVTESNCEVAAKNCVGSKALTPSPGKGLILLGVPNSLDMGDRTANSRFKTGMLEAHEFFHLLQDVPIVGKGLGPNDWPPRWVIEGGAEFIQNAVVNKSSFDRYQEFRKLDAAGLYQLKFNYTEKDLVSYLKSSNDDSKYDPWLAYNLGSRFIEILVALEGQNSLLLLNAELAKGVGFPSAFENTYEYSWAKALPMMAKVVALDIAQGR